jgi:branched-chain amino acid transport system permease protein
MSVADHIPRLADRAEQRMWFERIPTRWWVVGLILLFLPVVANNFWLFQVMGWTFFLGLGLSWWIVLPAAFLIAALFATIAGALAVRTEGIYTIMITLAIAAAFFYFTRQNYSVFNGYSGFNLVLPPQLFGVNWRDPVAFYYLTLASATLCYFAVVYIERSPFGLALQGVRDNPRRMAALGFHVTAHRVAAYALASIFASAGGILLVWQNAQIAPGTIGISSAIDILVVAVVGGMRRPLGPFIGAFIYVLLQVFSADILGFFGFSVDRFKLIIGIGFLAIVLFSPDGVLGLWDRWRAQVAARNAGTKGDAA